MKKIFHVIDSLGAGGAENIVYSLCKYIKDYQNIVVVLHSKLDLLEKIRPYAKVIVLSDSKYNVLKMLLGLFILIYKNKQSIFNGHLQVSSIFLSIIRIFIRFKFVLTLHAIPNQLPVWYNKIYPVLCKSCDRFIVEDQIAFDYLLNNKIMSEKIRYIPIGTERVFCFKEPDIDIRKELEISCKTPVLLNVARMVPAKGQKDLIYLMKDLKGQMPEQKFHLIIIGYGPEKKGLYKLAKELDVEERITFTGKRLDLHNFYASADWFIMPCYDESMGVVIYEALANNIPVIAYNNGSISEVIDSKKKGYLTGNDYKEIIAILIDKYPPLKLNLAKDDLYFYSAERMADDYERAYKVII